MKLFKLTTQDKKTRHNTAWGEGVTHTADLTHPPVLCTMGVIHAYHSPAMAILMNPAHAGIPNPLLWEAEGEVVADDGTKVGCRTLTTVRQLPLPECTLEQRVTFAVRCALLVYQEPGFVAWANNWLTGQDRSDAAAWAACDGPRDAAYKAYAAVWADTDAAWAANNAAQAAAQAAWAANNAARAAEAAARAAHATNIVTCINEVAMEVLG